LTSIYDITVLSAETIGAFNAGFDIVNLHHPTNVLVVPLDNPPLSDGLRRDSSDGRLMPLPPPLPAAALP
jgi:hypothetical protein